ncbi:hypothetical protein, partial [Vibrio crassostreae]
LVLTVQFKKLTTYFLLTPLVTSLFCLGARTSQAESLDIFNSVLRISGVVVSSVCSVEVESDTPTYGVIDFGQYNKSARSGVNERQAFSVKLYESQSALPGCSAFLAGSNHVSLKFGDAMSGQLDSVGVVAYGAGGGVRIAVTATNLEASNNNVITSNNSELTYPTDFAIKGEFGFEANVLGLSEAIPGTYSGALSLTLEYQ